MKRNYLLNAKALKYKNRGSANIIGAQNTENVKICLHYIKNFMFFCRILRVQNGVFARIINNKSNGPQFLIPRFNHRRALHYKMVSTFLIPLELSFEVGRLDSILSARNPLLCSKDRSSECMPYLVAA